ncbi:MAG: NAD-dependent epimerase/dehydratase family protein [Longimicrobiales bacterium]
MRIFLTGGSGLIGSHVAGRLIRNGHEVVALQRPNSDSSFLEALGCELHSGDVRDGIEYHIPRMRGCDAVVHCAALIYASMSWPEVRAVNVDGTRNVLQAAAEAGVSAAVHVSSIAVYGDPGDHIDEAAPMDRPLRPADLYARSKREAEAVAMRFHGRGMALTILRPSAVYGERDRLFAPKLARMVQLPLTVVMGPGTNTLPVVYAGNIAAGVESALSGLGAGRAFNMATDHPITQLELMEWLAVGLGRTPRFMHLPAGLIRRGAKLGETLGLKIPGARDLSLARVAALALDDNPYDSSLAREVLSWDPPHTHQDALRRTGEWLRKQDRR